MTNRYTDNVGGLDANDGLTLLTPKQHMHAHTGTNGDVMYVKGTGTLYDRPSSSFTLDWTALSGVTIRDWPGFPKPQITQTAGLGFGRCIGVGAGGSAMNTVQNLIIQDTTDGGIGSIGATGANLTVIGCELYRIGLTRDSGSLGGGISIGSTNAINSLIVRNTTIDSCGRPNIFAQVINAYEVGNCTLSNPGLANPGGNTGDCVEAPLPPANYWVHNNWMNHPKNSKQCIQMNGTTGKSVFEYNTMYGPQDGTGNSHKRVYAENFTIVRYNRFDGGGMAMNLIGGGQVYSNLIIIRGDGFGSNQGPVLIENVLQNGSTDVDNNTIYLLSGGAGFYSGISMFAVQKGRIRNNTISGFGVGIRRHSTLTSEDHNAVYGATNAVTNESLAAMTSTAILTDPMLDNTYAPIYNSPLIGAGTDLGYTDLNGIQSGKNPTIGCFEVPRRP